MNYYSAAGIPKIYRLQERIGKYNEYPTYKANKILEVCLDVFEIQLHQLKRKNRSRKIVYYRRIIYYLLHKYTKTSLDDIGRAFGQDHSNVHHHIKNVTTQYDDYADVKDPVTIIESLLVDIDVIEKAIPNRDTVRDKREVRREWNMLEEELLKYYYRQMTKAELAFKFERPLDSISAKMKELGLSKRGPRKSA